MNDKRILHGNNAKIEAEKQVTPRFTNYVLNDNSVRGSVVYNRLNDDAEFCKNEVDANKK